MEKNIKYEGNEIIAAFMKFPISEDNGRLVWYDFDGAKDVLYHESWDWLMPVVQKISTIRQAYSYKFPAGFDNLTYVLGINLLNASKDIEWVFHQTVRAIKWYNENLKQ